MLTLLPHNENDMTAIPRRRHYIKLRKPKTMKIIAKAIKLKASSPAGIMPIEVGLLLHLLSICNVHVLLVSFHNRSQFSSHNVPLSNVSATGPLDLRPRFSKVPPQKNIPVSCQTSHGWQDDVLTEVRTAHTTSVEQDDDMGNPSEEHEWYYGLGDGTDLDGQDTDVDDFANGTTYMQHNHVSDNEDSHMDSGYVSSSDNEYDRPHNCKWKRMADDLSEDSPSPQQQEQQLPCKICKSKGHVAARDYKVAVQQLIKFAIGDFHGQLTSQLSALASYPYPDLTLVILVILAFPFALYLSLQQSQYIWPDPFADEAYPCSVSPPD
ncbi:uncharacterized protein EDB93DRAFT_1252058 [Suillus bovinus]|uniref:uncharacterized protein n=1 Tax=Suillus bovinus TaxID=48563 RepID=UPI001B86F5D3|nr:uncharacterized protein EDB93DRAFT_1252058 [Suillus bovinus]KAG2143454.1 hypothetical protein EDB93DRAFT_1252058 [Suillus bovinus]